MFKQSYNRGRRKNTNAQKVDLLTLEHFDFSVQHFLCNHFACDSKLQITYIFPFLLSSNSYVPLLYPCKYIHFFFIFTVYTLMHTHINIASHKWSMTYKFLNFQGSKRYIYIHIYIYDIMKAICHPNYRHNNIVASQTLGYRIYGYALLVLMYQKRQQMLVPAVWNRKCFSLWVVKTLLRW